MIKLFKRIRQQLLTKNPPAGRAGKFSKYLIYAIGEIVLVVVGILIALSINNWNEDKKNREFEIFTLTEVNNNLKNDSVQIQMILDKRMAATTSLQNLSNLDFESMDTDQLAKDIVNLWGFDRFFPNRNGYEALKSRGFQISNPELRSALGKYYENDLVRVSASIYDIEDAFRKGFNPIVQKGYFGIRDEANALEIINPNDQNFQDDLKEYVTVLYPNHRASVKRIKEFSEINKKVLNIVKASLSQLTKEK